MALETLAPPDALPGCGPLLAGSERDPDRAAKPLRQLVFEHVRAAGQAARADVARALGVSAGTLTLASQDLIALGLLREVEDAAPRESTRGRPPVALQVVPESHRVVGIKLSDERHTAVLADFAGSILADVSMPTAAVRKTPNQVCAEVETLIDALCIKAGIDSHQIAAVGIGVSGLIDPVAQTIPWSPLLSERNCALQPLLEQRLGLPVLLDNDANVLTLAELWFGAGRMMSDFAVVTIENGVGMGLVVGNRLYRGARGMGMEFGHTKVQLDGALCRCGQRGCMEAYLADYALAREAATALERSPRNLASPHSMLESLYAEAKAGNIAARSIFRRAGRYLSVGLSNIAQLFDPPLIILSGERMKYDYLYADEVMAEMERLTLRHGRAPCRVEIHAWGDLIWARGASALALSAVTDRVLGAGA